MNIQVPKWPDQMADQLRDASPDLRASGSNCSYPQNPHFDAKKMSLWQVMSS